MGFFDRLFEGKEASAAWVTKSNSARHVTQVIINEEEIRHITPWIKHQLMTPLLMSPNLTWGMIGMFLEGFDSPGLFVKASGVYRHLRKHKCRLAFAFYKMPESGIFAALLDFPTFDLDQMVSRGPFVVESQWNPSDPEHTQLVDALVLLDSISIHFLTDNLQAAHSRELAIELECKQKIAILWEDAKNYNSGFASSELNFRVALDRYNRENPIDVSPILS